MSEKFKIIFEYIDESVFTTLKNVKYHLDRTCKGQYNLEISFNTKKNKLAKHYNLMGAPALVNLKTNQVVYGAFKDKGFLNILLKKTA